MDAAFNGFYSQEIEDNKINENIEAQLLYASNESAIATANTVERIRIAPATTENANRNTPTASTGAIPKRGFSYLTNSNLNPQNTSVKHVRFQKTVKPEPRNKNIEALHEIRRGTARISFNRPPNELQVKADTVKPSFGIKNLPGKLKPDAFDFLNDIPAKKYKIDGERRSTDFIHYDNLQYSQLQIEHLMNDEDSGIYSQGASAPPDTEHDYYEPMEFDNSNEDKQTVRPALPPRPPPNSKHLYGTILKSNAPLPKFKSNNLVSPNPKPRVSPCVKGDQTCKETSVSADVMRGKNTRTQTRSARTINPNIISRPLPPVPVSAQPGLILQPKLSLTLPMPPEFISRSLPLTTSDHANLILQPKRTSTSLMEELTSNPQPKVPIYDLSNSLNRGLDRWTGTSDGSSREEISTDQVPDKALPVLNLTDAVLELNKPTFPPKTRRATYEQILKETPTVQSMQSPQQRLAHVLLSQSQVSNEVLLSQHRISAAIASRATNLQKNSASATNITTEFSAGSLQNLNRVTDDEDYLLSTVRSPSTAMDTQKPTIPKRKVSNPLIKDNDFNSSNPPSRETRNPPVYPDIETLHSAINRPCLPQKLKTTQRSLSCTSLVQSFRDMSFAMWNPPPKDKRTSAGFTSFDRTTKDFARENENFRPKGFSVSNVEGPKVTAPKPKKSAPDSSSGRAFWVSKQPIYQSTEKNSLCRNAWYHDVDAYEGQRRLLNFIDQNGAFLIRPSSKKTNEIQHTACIVFSGRIINMHIRRKLNGHFAIGTERKGEQTFPTIGDLIKYHQEIPIQCSGQSTAVKSFSACLRVTPPKP